MIKIVFITNQSFDSTFNRNLLRKEIESLQGFKVVAITQSVNDALASASYAKPDLIILRPAESFHSFRQQIDAIIDYKILCPMGGLSDVIIMSDFISEYAARKLGEADYLYQFMRPAEPFMLAKKLMRMYNEPPSRKGIRERGEPLTGGIRELLSRLEVYPSLTGYKYILDAVILLHYHPGGAQFTKIIYPQIGKKYGKSPESVEKAIRFVISVAWKSSEWKFRFPYFKNRPSNSEFLTALSELNERKADAVR